MLGFAQLHSSSWRDRPGPVAGSINSTPCPGAFPPGRGES
ncbi:hypothetical protein HMPREF0682_1637 [Propionibacterium acidifaciens F0233]|uniref:Uncharacterized protein n=1 Tax=Propionibacterium acidifaciens F0233 TaxID=553198 RepID=U2R2V2_9ACTN|nr:hypothetical protein HMPREF0682_1637 [Propionibacterium acidifaciens F0233]